MKRMQASYAAGELAPSLHSRTDLAKWQIGLAEANNLLVHIHGGISNRPGTRYVDEAAGPNRLFPFEYSVDDTYVLEFSDELMRVIRNGALVQEPATIQEVDAIMPGEGDYVELAFDAGAVIHSEIDIRFSSLKNQFFSSLGLWLKNTGELIFWSYNGSSYTEEATGINLSVDTDYTVELDISGKDVTVTVGGSSHSFNIGTDTYNFERAIIGSTLFRFEGTVRECDSDGGLEVSRFLYQEGGVDVYDLAPHINGYLVDQNTSTEYFNKGVTANLYPMDVTSSTVSNPNAGQVYSLTSPFTYADLDEVRFVQREDVLYLTHRDYGEYKLVRYDHDNWEFVAVLYVPGLEAPTSLTGSYLTNLGGSHTGDYEVEYVVAAIAQDGEESLPSESVTVDAESSTSWDKGYHVSLSWATVPGADLYVVYKNSRGYYGYIGSTTGTTFKDDNISPDSADGPKTSRDPFSGAGNYPGSIGIYQQRKVYGRTTNLPQTTWLTQSGTMNNLSVSRPLKDTDAITAQLDSNQVNEILHFVPMKDLVVVTNNGVWTLSSGNNADALTPTANRYDLQSAYGGSKVPPIVSGNTILVVPNYRDGVREFFYQVQAGGLESTPLEVMSNHLFATDKIKEWAYQRDKSVLWCVMESGCINALTYMREHEVVAWTTVETAGDFESVCVVRSENRDTPYFTVKRNINGVDVRYIEELTDRLPNDTLEDGVFSDCSLSYDGAAATVFSNLDHLEGETVVALADGNVVEDLVVSSGSVTLPVAASKVHIGLPYQADFETLDVDYEVQDGTGFGDVKVINKVTLSLENTRGLQVGPTSSELTEMKDRTDEGYDEATRMFTGKKDIQIKPHWNSNGRVHVRQSYPLPMTILAHIPEVQPGDD